MNKLYVSTANSNLLVILKDDDKVYYKNEESVKKHNERILDLIDEILKENKKSLKDIEEFGVVIGPGSFTGIRVGIATIKAFKDVFKKKTVGVNNLTMLFNLAQVDNMEIVAIEGSLNSFFVAKQEANGIYIYNRNLTEQELLELSNGKAVGCYEISEKMKDSKVNFCPVKLDIKNITNTFEQCKDESLIPVYYQLSQAENDKINRGNLEIINMEKKHVKDISKLELTLFNGVVTGENYLEETMLTNMANNENFYNLVAILNGELVGYIFCEVSDEINVYRVAVKNQFQNHGIATKLINKAFEFAKENGINVSLEVSENNHTAINLYKKLGFEIRRIRKDYYKDKSNCLEMIKKAGN